MRIRNKKFNKKMLSFLEVKNIFKLKAKLPLALLFIIVAIGMPFHSASAGWATDIVLEIIYVIVYMLGAIVLWILSLYVMFGAWLVDVMLEPNIYAIVLDISDPAAPLMVGWTVIRDFANTFFIFILLLIAFSTILRIQKYSIKAFLPKFIIAIFLINFSALIAAVIIDFGQVFMYEIKGWLGAFGGNNGAMGNLTSMIDDLVDQYGLFPGKGGFSIENTVGVVFAVAFAAIMGTVYIMLAGFLLIRLVMLAILIVLSPIAFIGIILPGLNSQAGMWWKKIFEYSLFGPIFIFFIFLASSMSSRLTNPTYIPSTPNDLTGLSYLVTLIVPYCVSIGMLLAVVPITKQLGIAGTGALMGGAMGVGKIGMGAFGAGKKLGGYGKKTAGWTGRRAGIDSRKIGDVLRGETKKVAGKIPIKRVRNRVEGSMVLKEAKLKAEDRKNIEEKKGEIKELSGKSAVIAAKGIEAKKFRDDESLSKEDETKFIALMEHAASKGENLSDSDNFSEAQLTMATQRGADLDSIAKYDPVAAGKMKAVKDSSKTAEKHTVEYMQEHAESGEWKKYSAHVRQNNFKQMSEHIDSKELQNHIKGSGKKANLDYEIGADKYMQELYKAMNVATGATKTALQDELKNAQEKVRKATGNLEISDAKRNTDGYRFDTAAHTQIGHGKKASAGNVDLHDAGIQEAIKVSGGANFKKLTKESKVIYAANARNTGDIAGLRLRDEDSEVLRKMADAIKHSSHAIPKTEMGSHEILENY